MPGTPGMPMPRARATFKRMVSDGNFGHEVAEVTLEQDLLPGEADDGEITAALLLALARRLVEEELLRSGSSRVRQALSYVTPKDVEQRGIEWGLSNAAAEEHDIVHAGDEPEDEPF